MLVAQEKVYENEAHRIIQQKIDATAMDWRMEAWNAASPPQIGQNAFSILNSV